MATLCPPGIPQKGQGRKFDGKGGSWVHPWTPQEHPKSVKINRSLKVRHCVGVGMRFLCPRCRQVGAGYAETIVNTMVLEAFHVMENSVFLLFLEPFWTLCLLILEVLGRHVGGQKVHANFDRKTVTDLNPGIPGNPRESVGLPGNPGEFRGSGP